MLKIDNCKYCAAVTYTDHKSLQSFLREIISSDNTGCWLCTEDGNYHTEFDIFKGDKKIWCGHIPQCKDVAL